MRKRERGEGRKENGGRSLSKWFQQLELGQAKAWSQELQPAFRGPRCQEHLLLPSQVQQ